MPLFGKKKNKGPKPGPKNLRNKHLESTPQLLGGDSANEVYKTTYKDGKGISGSKTGYFKEDGPATIAKYAVGSSNLAQGLGLGDLVAETRYGKHDLVGSDGKKRKGVRGAVSKGAPGVALGDTVWDDDKTAVVQQARDQGLTEDDIQMAFSNMYKQRGDQWFANSGTEINEIDLSNPETQKGLNQLQWFDALIGNTDRHSGNILVDPATGKVVGIDNDLAFGKGHKAFDYEEEQTGWEKGHDEKYLGLPSLIDRELADKLLALDAKKLEKLLNPKGTKKKDKFTEDEIKDTLERLTRIQAKVQQMIKDEQVVDNWDDSTYQAQINEDLTDRQHAGNKDPVAGSYLQRHHTYMEKAKDTNDPMYWRKGHRAEDTTPAPVQQAPQPQPPQPQPPTKTPPPVPSPEGRRQLSGSQSESTGRSLSSRVLNTPWADQFKRRKQPV